MRSASSGIAALTDVATISFFAASHRCPLSWLATADSTNVSTQSFTIQLQNAIGASKKPGNSDHGRCKATGKLADEIRCLTSSDSGARRLAEEVEAATAPRLMLPTAPTPVAPVATPDNRTGTGS